MRPTAKGFTLVELMIVVAISATMFYGIYFVMLAGNRQGQDLEVRMTIQDPAREGLYRMIQEIRLSAPERIDIDDGGSSIQFQVPDVDNPVGDDFTVNWDNAETIEYAIGGEDDDQVIRTNVTTGETAVVAHDVVDIEFTGNAGNPTEVTITMQVQRETVSGRVIPETALQIVGHTEIRNT